MLLHRVLTALILLPLVIVGVLFLPSDGFALGLAVVVLLGAAEWVRLSGLVSLLERLLFLLAVALGLLFLYVVLAYPGVGLGLFTLVTVGWLLVTGLIIQYDPKTSPVPGKMARVFIGLFVLLPTWAALVYLHSYGEQGPALVLYALSLSWVADTGAYFSGRQWGRVKLAPNISPKKTREGVYGALVAVGLWSGLLVWLRPETGPIILIVLFCLAVCLISVVGDLFESLLKRQAGVKDSGNILPGHGGILDRIDSLTAVAPVFMFGLLLFGGGK